MELMVRTWTLNGTQKVLCQRQKIKPDHGEKGWVGSANHEIASRRGPVVTVKGVPGEKRTHSERGGGRRGAGMSGGGCLGMPLLNGGKIGKILEDTTSAGQILETGKGNG